MAGSVICRHSNRARADLAQRITAVWTRASLLAPRKFVPGVQRFRTIEEANDARQRATIQGMRQLRAERMR